MPPRDEDEIHRQATPLELLFDLVSVIAIAAAAAGLHHAISDGHALDGVIKFLLSMFAIWWAWMNYTWFASAYDNDDTLFRLLTMLIMGGSLTMAAGIAPFFHHSDLKLIVSGFVVMRVGMVIFWLRAARQHPERKATTLTYALGIAVLQVYWVGLMLSQPLPESQLIAFYVLGACLEMSLPAFAEWLGATSWHRHHMIERYGLLNIIVLGETLLAGSMAIRKVGSEHLDLGLICIVMSSMVILFSLWWLYFSKEEHIKEKRLSTAFIWGYGHFMIYAAGAAVGAGFAVMVDVATHHSDIKPLFALHAVTLPISAYLLGLWFVRDRYIFDGNSQLILPLFSALIVSASFLGSIEIVAVLASLCVVFRNRLACKKLE